MCGSFVRCSALRTGPDVNPHSGTLPSPRDYSRREFCQAAVGVVVFFSMNPGPFLGHVAPGQLPLDLETNKRLDSWLRINPDGTVEVFTGKVEYGQGAITALAQIAADELDVNFERIRMRPADTSHSPDESYTAGSASIEVGGGALRYAAADARATLLEMAAAKMRAPTGSLTVDDGVITTSAAAGRVTYWELASKGLLARDVRSGIPLKPNSSRHIVGTSVPRLDIPAKVTGGEAYVQDMRLPGMLFGRVVRPPSYGAQLTAFDDASAKAMPGVVTVVRNGRFLGVVARREEQAIAARAALQRAAVWTMPTELPDEASIAAFFRNSADAQVTTVSSRSPSVTAPMAVRTLRATYSKPYLAHASIGPSCAIAAVEDGVLTIWSHTQGAYPLRTDIAVVMGLPLGKVRIVHAQGSGCYGHNGADDVALDAALLSRAAGGAPVKVQWMRDDEFAWEPFGGAMSIDVQASVAADGSITDWQYDVWSNSFNMRPGQRGGVNLLAAWHLAQPFQHSPPREIPLPSGGADRNAVPYYDFPSQRITEHFLPTMPVRVSAHRSLGAFGNVFAVESFMDELAHSAGADPVEFRLRHLTDDRAKAVIRSVADRAKWRSGAKGDGARGRGIAFLRYESTKTYVAVIVDIVVDRKSNTIRVERITAAADSGLIITPDGISNQLEGAIIQGVSWALKERVRFDRQRVTSRDWNSYPILTFSELPEIDIVLLNRPDLPPLGAGEAALPPVPAAIANAFFHATGRRLRDLPFDRDRVKAALA
jgi:nicotinate dehydrogenase subunit B